MKTAGIYIHIPFCEKKCPYCDFYSRHGSQEDFDSYTALICDFLRKNFCDIKADTLYFGGGTPSIIGAKRLAEMICTVRECCCLDISENEITIEVNPSKEDIDFEILRKAGANRISVGMQSANDDELLLLGRQHSVRQVKQCIIRAKNAGFDNISLDIMIALPHQTKNKLSKSIAFCVENDIPHVSAYILKIEEGTVFYKKRQQLSLPDDDCTADLYEFMCDEMRRYGYEHYEISNFCKKGYESRHNLKYWHDEPYIGIGPSAHSFIDGKRWYYPRNMRKFADDERIPDGIGGDEEEFIMLGLRLKEGITQQRFTQRYGKPIDERFLCNAEKYYKMGLVHMSENGFSLTEKGFLVSNAVIAGILEV